MGLIAAALVGTAVAGVGSAVAASGQADAQNSANQANISNAQATNAEQVMLGLAARGGTLSGPGVPANEVGQASAILPYYFGNQEQNLANAATGQYNALESYFGTPQSQLGTYQNMVNQFNPAFAANANLANNVATGATGQQLLDQAQPVWNAQIAAAQTQRSAALQSLATTLNQIDAMQAKKGYAGDSLGSNLLRTNAGININTGAANTLSQAMVQTALEKQQQQQSNLGLQLNNINLPSQVLTQNIQNRALPASAVNYNQSVALQPFSMFNIGPGTATRLNTLPQVAPVANTQQIVGQTVGAIGGAASNLFLQKALSQQASPPNPNPGASPSAQPDAFGSVPGISAAQIAAMQSESGTPFGGVLP